MIIEGEGKKEGLVMNEMNKQYKVYYLLNYYYYYYQVVCQIIITITITMIIITIIIIYNRQTKMIDYLFSDFSYIKNNNDNIIGNKLFEHSKIKKEKILE